MLDVVQRQVELIVVALWPVSVLGTPVGQDADEPHALSREERQHPVVGQVGNRDRRLGGVELGRSLFGVHVHEGLLVDAPRAFDGADVERVLAA